MIGNTVLENGHFFISLLQCVAASGQLWGDSKQSPFVTPESHNQEEHC
jgi:hypothetical protein